MAQKGAELWHKKKGQSYNTKIVELCHKNSRIKAQKWQSKNTKKAGLWHKTGQSYGTKRGRVMVEKIRVTAQKGVELKH